MNTSSPLADHSPTIMPRVKLTDVKLDKTNRLANVRADPCHPQQKKYFDEHHERPALNLWLCHFCLQNVYNLKQHLRRCPKNLLSADQQDVAFARMAMAARMRNEQYTLNVAVDIEDIVKVANGSFPEMDNSTLTPNQKCSFDVARSEMVRGVCSLFHRLGHMLKRKATPVADANHGGYSKVCEPRYCADGSSPWFTGKGLDFPEPFNLNPYTESERELAEVELAEAAQREEQVRDTLLDDVEEESSDDEEEEPPAETPEEEEEPEETATPARGRRRSARLSGRSAAAAEADEDSPPPIPERERRRRAEHRRQALLAELRLQQNRPTVTCMAPATLAAIAQSRFWANAVKKRVKYWRAFFIPLLTTYGVLAVTVAASAILFFYFKKNIEAAGVFVGAISEAFRIGENFLHGTLYPVPRHN